MAAVVVFRPVALVAVAAALVAGCSGDDGARPGVATSAPAATSTIAEVASTEPEPVVTHTEFIARLDRICRRANRALKPFNKRYAAAARRGDYGAAARVLKASRKLDEPFYAEVAELEVPPEDPRGLDRYLALSHQLDVLAVRTVRALRRRDDEELTRLDLLSDRIQNRRTLVTAGLGLTECGS